MHNQSAYKKHLYTWVSWRTWRRLRTTLANDYYHISSQRFSNNLALECCQYFDMMINEV